jgi:hypothetical protein
MKTTIISKVIAAVVAIVVSIGAQAQGRAAGHGHQDHSPRHTTKVVAPAGPAVHQSHRHHHGPVVVHPAPVVVAPHHHHHHHVVAPVVVPAPVPPVGTIVEVLPANSISVQIGGVSVYVSGGIRYLPTLIGGRLLYKILG